MPLTLDLLRHGHAATPGPAGDALRPLTAAGRGALAHLARYLSDSGTHYELALTSPLTRAVETTEIVLRGVAPEPQCFALGELTPDAEIGTALVVIAAHANGAGHVLVVSHMPLLGELCSLLTADPATGFAPGELARIEFDGDVLPGAGRLVGTWRGERLG
ncbi:MAG: phosphohistidine phosphatase SixA [Candidatus Eisenbacteria bacterium]|uniref:Phosphohistidine phosphatase SixA n=1 Tax=Eiseniibacteriota bacterium TaxID=2212470 RepID=A0A849SAY3_UNCEI|nr:phosphohistidine phosphatase SixA [Candidatus Eisenbacteria bacterium]